MDKKQDVLKTLFNSKYRSELLKFFLFDENYACGSKEIREYSSRQIEKITKLWSHGIIHELKNLEKIGILKDRWDKSRHYYFVNKDCDFLDDIRNIIRKNQAN